MLGRGEGVEVLVSLTTKIIGLLESKMEKKGKELR